MLIMIDNYDSFTYNVVQYLSELGAEVKVCRNDEISVDEIEQLKPDHLVISPGPCTPNEAGVSVEAIKRFSGKIPLLGICLGHQIIGLALGGKTSKLKFGHHGGNHPVMDLQTQKIEITSQNHGFIVDIDSLSEEEVEMTHVNLNDKTLEGLRHKKLPLFSAQHHPENSPGPHDSDYLFTRFYEMIEENKNA